MILALKYVVNDFTIEMHFDNFVNENQEVIIVLLVGFCMSTIVG